MDDGPVQPTLAYVSRWHAYLTMDVAPTPDVAVSAAPLSDVAVTAAPLSDVAVTAAPLPDVAMTAAPVSDGAIAMAPSPDRTETAPRPMLLSERPIARATRQRGGSPSRAAPSATSVDSVSLTDAAWQATPARDGDLVRELGRMDVAAGPIPLGLAPRPPLIVELVGSASPSAVLPLHPQHGAVKAPPPPQHLVPSNVPQGPRSQQPYAFTDAEKMQLLNLPKRECMRCTRARTCACRA